MVTTTSFTIMDYAVLGATLLFSMLIGVYYGVFKKQETNSDLLVGGRSMPIIPTALSLLATYMSPILVLGYAGEIYSFGTLMYETVFCSIIVVPIAAWIFMPTLYNLKLTSAYEYLEHRFDSPVVRLIAAGTFITQVSLYMGVVLFAPALALNAVVDFPIWISVSAMGICCAIYTSIGGLKAVVWTDCFQMVIMLAGMFSIVIVGIIEVGGISKVFEIAQKNDRIQFLNFEVNPFQRLNSLNIFIGHGIMVLSICGCQQTAVQRYCSMSSLRKGVMALMITLPLVVFTVSLAALAGVVIYATYATCDPITLGLIKRNDQIAPYFVLEYLSPTSGLLGLFIACLFSASLSTVSSGLNSVTAVTFVDFFSKINYFRKMTDKQQGGVSKLLALFYGLVIIGMAFMAGNFDGVLAASIVLNGSVAGPLLAVFLLGILLPFTNKYGAIVGMLIGHATTIWISIGSALFKRKHQTLEFSTDECSEEMWSKVNKTMVLLAQNMTSAIRLEPMEEVPWPQKIYTVSFLLYPLIGCSVTIIVGSFVSLLTGYTKFSKDQEKYILPLLAKILRAMSSDKSEMERNGKVHGIKLSEIQDKTISKSHEGQNPKEMYGPNGNYVYRGQNSYNYQNGDTNMKRHNNNNKSKHEYDNGGFHES